jgi:SAM-dependent methyltransferase
MRIKDGWSPVGRGETLQDYYTVRQPSSNHSQYWTSRVDPDGRLREKISEQERVSYLENIDEELLFVRSLEPGRIVDFGCGPGWFLESLCRHWDKMGIEIAPHAVAELQRKGITVVDSTAEVPDAWADVVFCHHVIEHLSDPIAAIGEIHRMLCKGGWLIIGTPDFESPCAKRFGSNYRLLHDGTHCSLFTLESMHRFLRDHGFFIKTLHFPFPEKYATPENFARWNDTSKVSPPWPGNWMTFYCVRS